MTETGKRNRGFTMVELLIVVAILGILAAVVIPQFSGSTDDAKLATLDANLSQMRNAVELYYHHHNRTYPGASNYADGSAVSSVAEADTSFLKQLTLYSDVDGVTSGTYSDTYKYGPYIKRLLPPNPFNEDNVVKCDIAEDDITAAASDGASGWIFFTETGILLANDGSHDSH
jgi:prepilin-type N-terminal cleavage/methylation domain-containing protein